MDSIPKISVVIPTYNRSKTIKYCLDSVLNQTLPPFEILVIDDLSTDDTLEIIREYRNPIIKLIALKEKAGAQKARNIGIKNAKGNWIAFLDSDDKWVLDKLEKQRVELEKNNFNEYLVIHGNCKTYTPHIDQYGSFEINDISGRNVMPTLLTHPAPFFQAMLTSKKALEEIGLLDENVPAYQEWDTSIQLSKICSFIHIQDTLFIYYMHNDETISKDKAKDILGYNYIRRKYRNETIEILGKQFYHFDYIWNINRAFQNRMPTLGIKLLEEKYPNRPLIYVILKFLYQFRLSTSLLLKTFNKLKYLVLKNLS